MNRQKDHVYEIGDRLNLSSWPVTTSSGLEKLTAGRTFPEDVRVFKTSGSTGQRKRIPYSPRDQEVIIDRAAKTLKRAGVSEDDAVLSLGAPVHPHEHISGWAFWNGTRCIGADPLNRSFMDYEEVLRWGDAEEVTVVYGAPLPTQQIGSDIEESFGALEELFPNIRLGVMASDLLTHSLRTRLRDQWRFDEIRNLYGTTETCMLAVSPDETDHMEPLTDRNEFSLELLPEDGDGYAEDPVPLESLEEPQRGSLLITDPYREILPLVRYRIGDIVKVHPDYEQTRIEVLGREDDTISFGGAPLYSAQIGGALEEACPDLQDWRAVASRERSSEEPVVEVYAVTQGDVDRSLDEVFREELFRRNTPIKEAHTDLGIGHISVRRTDSYDELAELLEPYNLEEELLSAEGSKIERIGFDASYSS